MSIATITRHRGSFYHVVLRGNRREALFATPADRRALNGMAKDAMRRFGATLHAYCLMPNQFRLLVQSEETRLIKALRHIVAQYTRYRQRHAKSTEDIFERPCDAKRVETGMEFLHLLRSIHLTPVTTNKVVSPDDYLWSSHRAYLGFNTVAQVTTEFGLSLLAPEIPLARVAYYRFIAEGLAADVGSVIAARAFDRALPIESESAPQKASLRNEAHAEGNPNRFPGLRRRRRHSARRHLSIY